MPERKEQDIKFVRSWTDAIPTKIHPQPVSEQIVQQWRNLFKELVKGGPTAQYGHTDFVSHRQVLVRFSV